MGDSFLNLIGADVTSNGFRKKLGWKLSAMTYLLFLYTNTISSQQIFIPKKNCLQIGETRGIDFVFFPENKSFVCI
jgi:hypothetical protein